ncbi:MAG TPA: sodium/solute symporter [Candidatus Bathyarchaeia archaeon]|nr:sodium/solute symporter [Candidatus Bathyarchaeia archaeon]
MPQALGHMAPPDFFMIASYAVLMLGIGVFFYGRMKRMKDYFSGGNTIPWWLSGVSFYMSSFSVMAFVVYPGLCYRHGWVGITLLWVAVPATLFGMMFFAVRWRRARVDSPVEYLETRYSPLFRQLCAWQGVPVRMVDDGMKLFATGTFISVCAGLDIVESILIAGGIILLYTFMGGLWAVAVTDFIQFVVLTAGILVVLPLSIARAGGLSNIFANTPEGFFRLTSAEYRWSYVIPLIALYALAWSSINWSLIQRYYCVPKERDAVKVGALVIGLYLIGPPIMFFPAIAATQFLPGIEDAGRVYPMLCTQLLPAGMLGLAVAAMFAATMSTLSSDYNVCASVLTNDVYKRLARPDASQFELVLVGRLMTLVIGFIALGTALVMSQGKSEDLFKTMVTLFGIATAPVAVPMLLGLIWRKATNAGAIAGFAFGLSTGLILYKISLGGAVEFLGMAWKPETEEVAFGALFALKMEIVMFLATALVTCVVMAVAAVVAPASASTRARVEQFFQRLLAPIGTLDDDFQTGAAAQSPFMVVGVAILLVGVLLLAVAPWVGGGQVLVLDLIIGGLLAAVGSAMAWLSAADAQKRSAILETNPSESRLN